MSNIVKLLKNKALLFLLLICTIVQIKISKAQIGEIGVGLGNVTYIGDIDKSLLPSKLNPAISLFYKRNSKDFSNAIRLQLSYLKISGSSSDNVGLQRIFNDNTVSFNSSVLELDILGEYNFLNFGKRLTNSNKREFFTPYIFGGVGLNYILNSNYSFSASSPSNILPVIPIGIGLKTLLGPYLVLGTEFTLRKTFTDKLDGLDNDPIASSSLGSDLYYSVGFTLSYIIRGVNCPIPSEREPKGKIIKEKKFPFF